MLNAADDESVYMNVNLSNVSATNKVSVTDSSSKVVEENSESKGFFETLAGVFSDSQKAEKAVAKSDAPDASVETKDEVVNDASADSEAESQAKVSAEGGEADKVASTESTDELLEQSESKAAGAQNGDPESKSIKAESASLAAKPTQDSQTNIAQTKSSEQPQTEQVKSAMGEGQQLLGRIEQANQTLQSNELSGGKALPPESVMVSAGASLSLIHI